MANPMKVKTAKPVRLDMTGKEFKTLIEQVTQDGKVNTLPELFELLGSLPDDMTLEEYIRKQAVDAATVLTQHQDISGKADKDTSATAGNIAKFDANGNPVDSGIAATDLATIDADAVEGNIAEFDANGNPVDSGHALSEYKTKQTAVADSDATTSGNDTTFVDSVTQDENGEISVHKKTVPNVSASTSGTGGTNGLMLATDKEKLDGLLECSDSDIDSIFA